LLLVPGRPGPGKKGPALPFPPIPTLLAVFLAAGAAPAQSPQARPGPRRLLQLIRAPAVRKANLRAFVRALAGPGTQGREAGTPGFDRAAEMVRRHLKAWGLPSPPGVEDYFQPVPLLFIRLGKPIRFAVEGTPMRLFRDFVPRQDSGLGKASGRAVYVGLGFSSPELGVDFLKGKDLRGKIAVIDRDAWKGLRSRYYSLPYEKRLQVRNRLFRRGAILAGLAARGAVGAVSFRSSPPRYSARSGRFRTGSVDEKGRLAFFEGVQIAQAFPPTIPGVEVTHRVGKALPGKMVEMEVNLVRESRKTANILAVYPGTDPGGKVVVLGAHLDGRGSIRINGKPVVLPGLNNNAAGCAVLLETARVLSMRKPRLKNTLLFAFFSAREKFLAGSRTFVTNPPYPLSRFLAMVNLVGPGKGLEEAFGGLVAEYPPGSKALPAAARKAAALAGLPLALRARSPSFGADHWSFYDRKIPFLFLHGDRSDFSLPGPGREDLDWDLLFKAARAFYDIAVVLGDTPALKEGKKAAR